MVIDPYVLYIQKKPHHPYFQHTKYEPDISNYARKKWGVKITVDFQSPCSKMALII